MVALLQWSQHIFHRCSEESLPPTLKRYFCINSHSVLVRQCWVFGLKLKLNHFNLYPIKSYTMQQVSYYLYYHTILKSISKNNNVKSMDKKKDCLKPKIRFLKLFQKKKKKCNFVHFVFLFVRIFPWILGKLSFKK